ncbi:MULTISPECIES: tetratricopeptide repeat protein [unclassified Crossiella]|uniref:tetratricopeptide repeat protein n=1 Tax=unclassified Crossiella TaxID=2620835 RepID=UPI001FFF5E64|nr:MULTISPECIES: tetratricopeptide repeat protein [unclassified Crossiella]MCK2241450.1 tetratricopeptide repeat protein [Crossiella sp. S99.2]MCK2255678.1 tetratricopeptide repeat protein [Crossiella sp. S99.1]
MTDPEWEGRLAATWAQRYTVDGHELVVRVEDLAAELPPCSPVAAFERACSWDASGHSDRAVPLYREALERGLDEHRRRRAVIQLASSLRTLGEAEESVRLLTAERERTSDDLDDAVRAFLALALADCGRDREALAVAMETLSPHIPCYQRALSTYARHL